jgi:hypothetical protein
MRHREYGLHLGSGSSRKVAPESPGGISMKDRQERTVHAPKTWLTARSSVDRPDQLKDITGVVNSRQLTFDGLNNRRRRTVTAKCRMPPTQAGVHLRLDGKRS